MLSTKFLFIVTLLFFPGFFLILIQCHPDEGLSIVQLIKKHNYPIEIHKAETTDGYILTIHRIPYGINQTVARNVVLLVHGMGGSAENFILLGPPNATAFYLSDRGYDVWLFNARGTIHSRKHRILSPYLNRKQFWNFGWHEIGVHDLPTTIGYILNKTESKKIFYVGHSQGATSFVVMLSEFPEMNDKISVASLLAPSSYLGLSHNPYFLILSKLYGFLKRIAELMDWVELLIPNSPNLNGILKNLCRPISMQDLCIEGFNLIGGTDSNLINKAVLPIILEYTPSGFAIKQLMHYGQIMRTKNKFSKFDYGRKKNLEIYNSTVPPEYNLRNVKVPIMLLYGSQDPFCNPAGIAEMKKNLSNIVLDYRVPYELWNHLDFIFAYNLKEIINDPMYEVFKSYEIS